MNKVILSFLFIFTTLSSFSQDSEYGTSSDYSKPSVTSNKLVSETIENMFENGRYKQFTSVVECPNKNKSEIYTSIKLWYGKTFKSAKEVIQTDVPGEIIVGTGNTIVSGVRYSFEIITIIKDYKFKTNINFRELTNPSGVLQYFPPLETFYSDWKNKKAGFFSKTGSMEWKESVLYGIYNENIRIVETIKKEINTFDNF